MTYFAHSGTLDDKSDWQTMSDHSRLVGEAAAQFAKPFGLEKAGRVAGLMHDLGKYNPEFQRRLEGADIRVDHSTAGAKLLMDISIEARRKTAISMEDHLIAELIAYAVLGHHAGLPDRTSSDDASFERRIARFEGKLDPIWKEELDVDLSGLMPERIARILSSRPARTMKFDVSVVARMLFSCLVDADYKDTEAHYAKLEQRQPDRHWSSLQDLLPDLIDRFDAYMAAKPADGEINGLRRDILAHVRAKAAMRQGLFTLTVPTGGGKTLASLGFALDHARIHGHDRIIYGIPFTSIIDQTAQIFRAVLGEDHVLEHHSAIEADEDAAGCDRRGRATSRDRLKLAMEDWAAPVVVTTNVQFFESLFASRTTRARKLHNIANSVIILDEAQTIPRHLLKPCIRMLDSLAHLFGCTIVLCTATQPALGKSRQNGGGGFPEGLDLDGRELAPDPSGLASRLRRTRLERVGDVDNAALVKAVGEAPQALVIVNSRRHALDLYRAALDAGLSGTVHLSTRQCAAHRREILADVRLRLEKGLPCRVIATSLVEAGVDIDFPAVWRAEAGLDSIVQAAGRCNREGKRPWQDSVVSLFSTPDYKPPREIAGLIGDMGRMTREHDDLFSLAAVEQYFDEVYWRLGPQLDERKIVEAFRATSHGTDFAFRSVGNDFRMIESSMQPVIFEWDAKAKKAVEELSLEKIPSGVIARKLQTYIIQVPSRSRELLIRNGHVAFACPEFRGDQFAVLKKESLYETGVGLLWDSPEYLATEDSFI